MRDALPRAQIEAWGRIVRASGARADQEPAARLFVDGLRAGRHLEAHEAGALFERLLLVLLSVPDSIEPSILNRLRDVGRGEIRHPGQVRDRARDLKHAVVGARGKP